MTILQSLKYSYLSEILVAASTASAMVSPSDSISFDFICPVCAAGKVKHLKSQVIAVTLPPLVDCDAAYDVAVLQLLIIPAAGQHEKRKGKHREQGASKNTLHFAAPLRFCLVSFPLSPLGRLSINHHGARI